MVNDPWAASRSRADDDALEATAAPTAENPWATQEQPVISVPAPFGSDGPVDFAALAQELVGGPARVPAYEIPAAIPAQEIPVPIPAYEIPAPMPAYEIPAPMPAYEIPAPMPAYEIPAAVERTAVPMPDLEVTSSGERTVVVGRYGPYDFVLRLADGQGHPIDGPILFGRRPDPLRGPEGARLVVIDDPQRTVSRSHLLVEPRADGILLRNLSMVNALVLVSPEGDEAEVEPGGAITVTGACSVILGAVPVAVERI